MTTIPALPRGVSDYVAAFDLTAVCVTRDGRLVVSRNPAGHEAVYGGVPPSRRAPLCGALAGTVATSKPPPAALAYPSPCTALPWNGPRHR